MIKNPTTGEENARKITKILHKLDKADSSCTKGYLLTLRIIANSVAVVQKRVNAESTAGEQVLRNAISALTFKEGRTFDDLVNMDTPALYRLIEKQLETIKKPWESMEIAREKADANRDEQQNSASVKSHSSTEAIDHIFGMLTNVHIIALESKAPKVNGLNQREIMRGTIGDIMYNVSETCPDVVPFDKLRQESPDKIAVRIETRMQTLYKTTATIGEGGQRAR